VQTAEPVAVLTFDDGPEPNSTEVVLAELGAAGATATFFVLVRRARRHRRLLAEIIASGHDVALHGADHRRLTSLDPGNSTKLLHDARAELEQLAGVQVRMFRPPYGSQSPAVWHAVVAAGLVPVLWEVECREWDPMPDTDPLADFDNLRRGSIVLGHDAIASVEDGAESLVVSPIDRRAITTAILARIQAAGLRAISLSRALERGRPRWRVWLDKANAPST